jgi:hypothetical protein
MCKWYKPSFGGGENDVEGLAETDFVFEFK